MMKSFILVLMFSGSTFALSANAFAQTSPNTTETDQSEEDWRKSQKKGGNSTEDILDIIKNTRSTGVGNGRGYSPIDALPEESRRHLMRERAKRMAQAGPNEPVDVSYTPSEAAKTDSDLENDEKAAWEEMSKGMNGTSGQGQQGQEGQGQQSQGGGSGSQGQEQGGGQASGSSDSSGQNGQSRSVMRGGSAASVSDIMARIKGVSPGSGGAGQGQSQQGTSGQGQSQPQSQQGQSGQGQQSQQSQSQQVQSQQSQSQSGQAQSQQDGQQQSTSQADAQAQAQAEAARQAHSVAHSQDAAQTQSSTRTPEATSPLDHIKDMKREQTTSGTRSSALDFLKKKE